MHASIHGTIGQTTNMVEKALIMMFFIQSACVSIIMHIRLHMDAVVLLE